MVKKETFINILELYRKFDKKTDDFNKKLEDLLNVDFETDKPIYDGSCWMYWPIDGLRQVLKQIIMDFGESEDGADWWIFENGFEYPTEISEKVNGKEVVYKIENDEDAYNYLKSISGEKNA